MKVRRVDPYASLISGSQGLFGWIFHSVRALVPRAKILKISISLTHGTRLSDLNFVKTVSLSPSTCYENAFLLKYFDHEDIDEESPASESPNNIELYYPDRFLSLHLPKGRSRSTVGTAPASTYK